MQLSGKTAIVTGAGRGLGRAIALGYAREGAAVVLAARSEDEVGETAWLIDELGQKALAVPTDVRQPDAVQNLVTQAQQTFGDVDILVNSAGVGLRAPLQETTEEQWDSAFDTLLKSIFLLSQACLPNMIERKQGNIINIGAPLDKIAVPGFGAYYAAKCGVEGLSRVMAKELRRYGINVNVLHPGGFADTRMVRETVPEATKGLLSPEVVVEAALALAAQQPRGQTGQVIDAHTWNPDESKLK